MENIQQGRKRSGSCQELHVDTGLARSQKVPAEVGLSEPETEAVRTCHPGPSRTYLRQSEGEARKGDEPLGCSPFLCLSSGLAPHLSEVEKNEGWCSDDNGNDILHLLER